MFICVYSPSIITMTRAKAIDAGIPYRKRFRRSTPMQPEASPTLIGWVNRYKSF